VASAVVAVMVKKMTLEVTTRSWVFRMMSRVVAVTQRGSDRQATTTAAATRSSSSGSWRTA
jgi:hypothetical protein